MMPLVPPLARTGIRQLLIEPYSPTTTGKVERWHQTLQTPFLNDAGPFATITAAQAAVDAWHQEYNTNRPHQPLDMAAPAERFGHQPTMTMTCLYGRADLQSMRCLAPRSADTPGSRRIDELAGRDRGQLGRPDVREHDCRLAAIPARPAAPRRS